MLSRMLARSWGGLGSPIGGVGVVGVTDSLNLEALGVVSIGALSMRTKTAASGVEGVGRSMIDGEGEEAAEGGRDILWMGSCLTFTLLALAEDRSIAVTVLSATALAFPLRSAVSIFSWWA